MRNSSLISIFICFVLALTFAGCVSKTKDSTKDSNTNPRNLALQYLSQNQLDEAQAAFQQAIKLNPEDTSSYIGLTRLYLLQKNYDAAEKVDKEGLKLNPGNVDLKLLLAKIYSFKNENEKASKTLMEIIEKNPKNAMAYYMLAGLDTNASNLASHRNYLLKVQELLPANIVPRIELSELFAKTGKTDSSLFYLQSVKKIAPAFSKAAGIAFDKAVSSLQGSQTSEAIIYLKQFHELMKISPEYGLGVDEIEIPKMIAGYFDFDTNVRVSAFDSSSGTTQNVNNSFKAPLVFKLIAGIPGSGIKNISNVENSVLAVADYDAQANMYIYSSFLAIGATSSSSSLSVNQSGSFKECSVTGGIQHKGKDIDATFADFDNDGYQDLVIATTNGILVFKNKGDGTFEKVTNNIGFNNSSNATSLLFGDFDQDGDLDLLVGTKNGKMLFRNNGDGSFKENAAAMNLAADKNAVLKMDFGDWDNDGDLDIFTLEENGSAHLLNNNRHSNFNDISNSVGLSNPDFKGTAMAIADYNNDGTLDILIGGGDGGKCYLLKNEAGQFVPDKQASLQLTKSLEGIKIYDIAFVDYDNDGYEDIVVAGVNANNAKQGVKLFHNDGQKGFTDASTILPDNLMQANRIGLADFNFDGDRDIFFSSNSGVQLARNDGGNSNNFVQVQLTGLSFGSSKNNRIGIGAQVELKAGDLYQLKTVKGPLTEFGVGSRTKLDALRIIWPNGVPQTIVDPTRKQRALEQAQLKGSCPYLFTWDGKEFVFIKDMLWRSALGMPVAIHGKDTTFAYKQPSKEWLLIPGEKLKPRNGLYTLKVSEELWEAVYFDKAALVAIDHPDSVDTYVNEKFVAPPYPGKKIYQVSHPQLPVSATDGIGNNVLPKLVKYDFQYVSNFSLGKFQGLAEEHDLILDLGKNATANSLLLYMRGWIFPPDASINTELTQTNKYKLQPPSLQVINKDGKWQTVIKDIGYPMGRDKMVIVDLSHKFLTPHDRRIRIRTTMQIYWDHIFFSTGKVDAPVKSTDLKMVDADLDFRGYSESYRKGGPFGPEWVNYYKVTKGQKWRDLTGNYTRYGNVLPLLQKADDQYIICNGGDEVTIDFDASNLPKLPKGWKRDFLIYSEGWVKDGDMNTAHGQTVSPLPFHDMPSYPYPKNITYPTDKAHREYQEKYNTRKINTDDFKNAIRLGTHVNPKN
ncbi:MAG: FG-GAP-like repeat-containing protein [Ginsengibacter sp.]